MLRNDLSLVPARRDLYQAKMVFWLFMASLGMFFIASLVTYVVIRTQAFRPTVEIADGLGGTTTREVNLTYQPLRVPLSFWGSTLLLVLIGIFLQRACWMVRRERQKEFRRWLIWAWCAALVFMLIQSFGLNHLLRHHFTQSDGSTKVYGMSFTLALLHALHVLGGMAFLGYVINGAMKDRYDHERHWAVDHCAGYWHFLDVVWVCMLVMFAVTR